MSFLLSTGGLPVCL